MKMKKLFEPRQMNKLIKEFAVEAQAHALVQFNGDSTKWSALYNQKFAELIIQECRDIVEQDMKLAHIQMIPLTLEKYANGRLKEKIKQHFGVEE
jgi:hypothetical protein